MGLERPGLNKGKGIMRVLYCVTLLLIGAAAGCLPADEPLPLGTTPAAAPAEEATPAEGAATPDEGAATPEESSPAPEASPATPEESSAPPAESPSTPPAGSATKASEPVGAPASKPAPPSDAGAAAQPGMEKVEADVGVGKKGRSLDEYDSGVEGAIAGPAKAYFGFREKAIFQMQIPQAMQFYKAENGTNPKTHDEFMSKIIQANQINLPELPQGQKYVYDPEKAELMVVRPK